MRYREEAVVFDCKGDQLVGVATLALAEENPSACTGVVVVVGGPQYRAGSHRQFVLLARHLAATGIPVLRFDYRGMGDSTGGQRAFEDVNDDIACAIGALCSVATNVKNVALWGLCDGASAALLYCHAVRDDRVVGLCLLNPWVRSEATLARTQVKHYYTQRLRQKEFWNKLLSGKVAWNALTGLANNLKLALSTSTAGVTTAQLSFQDRMAAAWMAFDGPILLLLSGDDYTAKEFLEYVASNTVWFQALTKENLVLQTVVGADHTFSEIRFSLIVEKCTYDFLSNLAFH